MDALAGAGHAVNSASAGPDPSAEGVVLRGVSKRYREGASERTVLSGLDASIPRGGVIALYGRSGSGKSTLLNLLAGVDLPDAGDVVLFGSAINRLSERDRTLFRRRRIGFVFQFFNLIPTLTVRENVLLRLDLDGRTGADDRASGDALLAEVGLADRARSYPDRLSGGEQQRVAIAAALAHRPELVLADEPTGNLDEANAAQALALLARLIRASGATMVVATHSREVAAIADRSWTLAEGSVV
ncbi:MAG: ABC transporter ATP-binding protein [Planctomycetes bacterium]|nr:ABC transporter ATP-binding protein [Planctomycetota bacterium]